MNVAAGRTVRDAMEEAADRRRRRRTRRRWTWFAAVAAAVFTVDQLVKVIVRAWLEPGEQVDLIPGIDLVRARNDGIAFGLLPGNRAIVVALTVAALVLIAAALARLSRRNVPTAVGGGLLIGGSVGNLVDRLIHGGVTDYIDLPAWPAFNLADLGIIAGAALLAIGLLRAGAAER